MGTENNKHAGATTKTLSNAKRIYLAVRVNSRVYGVVGIYIGDEPLDAFEKSILLSILGGECALSLENKKNAREKEAAAILAKNEQLRANLLRAISHELRTPLTSISAMQVIFYQTVIPLMKQQKDNFILKFSGLSICWKICFRS